MRTNWRNRKNFYAIFCVNRKFFKICTAFVCQNVLETRITCAEQTPAYRDTNVVESIQYLMSLRSYADYFTTDSQKAETILIVLFVLGYLSHPTKNVISISDGQRRSEQRK